MTSTGRLLSGTVKDRKGLADGLRGVLKEYAKLPEAERRAKAVAGEVRPVPPPPPGGLVLTVYDRALGRDEKGMYRLPEGKDLGGLRTHAPHGQRSSVWLSKDEHESLIPAAPKKGDVLKLPAKLVRRVLLYGMWPQSLWVVEQAWQPDSVREGEIELVVEHVGPCTVRLRLRGKALLVGRGPLKLWPTGKVLKTVENRYDARLSGVVVIDREEKQVTRWNMVALGDYVGCWFAGNRGWKEATAEAPMPFGFAFEVDQSAYRVPAERRRPRSFVHAYIFNGREPFYWHPEKWEEDWRRRNGR
jgi:hypothetical protein